MHTDIFESECPEEEAKMKGQVPEDCIEHIGRQGQPSQFQVVISR